MKCWGIAIALLLAGWSAQAQNFPSGTTEIATGTGTLRVHSGWVGNFNAHDFHVYSFQLKVDGTDEPWNQIPLVIPGQPQMEFLVKNTTTADFTTRDAVLRREGGHWVLTVAELKFDETPYDDDAWVELRSYVLRPLDEEHRWIFEQSSTGRAPQGMTVDDFIESASGS